uniref:Uncharacterized protein n=1 Tax=Acrobeloides nanus TaxID=290746 RepID=A0A914C7R6_9BILA
MTLLVNAIVCHKMSTTSNSGWYQKCLSTRSVPLKLLPDNPTSTECYALRIQSAEFNQGKTGQYRLHVHLYDTKYKQFFGRKFRGALRSVRSSRIEFQTEVFFHSTIRDERIILVVEISRKENNDELIEAWTVVPVFRNSQPITDYASNSTVPIQLKKYQLYNGSSKILYYVNALDTAPNLTKANGVIECTLQTHQRMTPALDFIPEFVLISNEHIPGLKTINGVSQLAFPTPADTFAAVLDNVSISFGMHADRIEWLLLELINREQCFQLNKPPNDPSVDKLQILERRLRVGVHNGFTFVEEPLCLYLTSKDEAASGSHSYRRRSRSLSRMTPNVRSEFDTFTVKNAIKLSKLCADEDFAIVFAIDYLVGVQKSESSVSNSRFIMVCWGAWCPYQNSTFSLSDSISVPLVGGPRPNADEVFCFRSLLRIRENEYEAFSDGRPRIILRFNFALVGSTDNRLLLQILSRSRAETSGRQTTPLPKPDIVVKPRKEVPVELEEESEEVITHPTPRYPVVDHIIEEPILTPYKDLSRRRTFSTFERRRETHVEADYTIESTSARIGVNQPIGHE